MVVQCSISGKQWYDLLLLQCCCLPVMEHWMTKNNTLTLDNYIKAYETKQVSFDNHLVNALLE